MLNNLKKVFAPRHHWQAEKLLESWWKKTGIIPIDRLWSKGKEEYRLWIFPIPKTSSFISGGWRRDGGKTPFEKLKDLGYDLPWEFALFPSVILDTISTSWLLETGNELLAHYNNE